MKRTMGRYAKPGRILALLLCLLLLIGMLPSFGALGARKKKDAARKNNTGSLNVALASDIFAKLPKNAKVEFTLYQIGQAAPETAAGWTIDSDLSKYKILQAKNSEDLGRAAAELAAKVVADDGEEILPADDVLVVRLRKGETVRITRGRASATPR